MAGDGHSSGGSGGARGPAPNPGGMCRFPGRDVSLLGRGSGQQGAVWVVQLGGEGDTGGFNEQERWAGGVGPGDSIRDLPNLGVWLGTTGGLPCVCKDERIEELARAPKPCRGGARPRSLPWEAGGGAHMPAHTQTHVTHIHTPTHMYPHVLTCTHPHAHPCTPLHAPSPPSPAASRLLPAGFHSDSLSLRRVGGEP